MFSAKFGIVVDALMHCCLDAKSAKRWSADPQKSVFKAATSGRNNSSYPSVHRSEQIGWQFHLVKFQKNVLARITQVEHVLYQGRSVQHWRNIVVHYPAETERFGVFEVWEESRASTHQNETAAVKFRQYE
ncbi:hypothetical protein TNCV_3290611 [Trichonephila clavipes]|nr:hypothetical protein TNCV_3290611 [Trichonephila clavipes]